MSTVMSSLLTLFGSFVNVKQVGENIR